MQYKLNQRPRTKFQKEYTSKITVSNKFIYHFPGRLHNGIPKETRITKGVEPSKSNLAKYIEIWQLTKSELGYNLIDDFLALLDIPEQTIYNEIIWLVKNQIATINVDRFGNAVYFKFTR